MRYGGYYLSAYGLAVKHGYRGTEEEWLASLYGRGLAELRALDDGTLQAVFTDGTSEDITRIDKVVNVELATVAETRAYCGV